MVGDHCTEEAMVREGRIIAGVGDGAGQADGFKGGGGVVELDEGFDAVGVGSGKGAVEGVEARVRVAMVSVAGAERDLERKVLAVVWQKERMAEKSS
eukprot:scaffold14268_cov156-Amphora_coffeaeformis.AAC.2